MVRALLAFPLVKRQATAKITQPADTASMPTPAADRDAPWPFNKAYVDTILRTSDGVNFRIRNAILSEASVFFEGLFSCPQPPGALASGALPVIDLPEDSKTIDPLLRLCYPMDPPEFDALEQLEPVLRTAHKYVMDPLMPLLRKRLLAFAEAEPMRVYLITYQLELEADIEAAKAVLQVKWCDTYYPELEDMPAEAYFRPLQAHLSGKAPEAPPVASESKAPGAAPAAGSSKKKTKGSEQKPAESEEKWETPGGFLDCRFQDAQLIIPAEYKAMAPYPFNMSDADANLCSADAVEYRVHASILSIASPVFQRMLLDTEQEVEHRRYEPNSDRPLCVIAVAEDSRILTALLRFCYPVDDPEVEDLEWAETLLRVAKKYQMATVIKQLRATFAEFAEERPLRVYTAA